MDTPLNKAHFYARRAMQYSSDQKIEYIEKCIENFDLALSQTSNSKAIESIQLQKKYYEKQLMLLNYKKTFRNQKLVKQQRAAIDESSNPAPIEINDRIVKASNIQLELFKNIEASDCMLEEMRKIIPDNSNFKLTELMNLNSQFNELFYQLTTLVDETVQENERLKERLRDIEVAGYEHGSGIAKTDDGAVGDKEAQRDSDSSPDDLHELPPLELPEFNLDSLGK